MTQAAVPVEACVFDAYGTLFDVASPTRRTGATLGDQAAALAAVWRTRQVEYTWLRSLMGRYADFWQITGEALDYAMAAEGIADPALRARLMELYLTLDVYPDVEETLIALKGRAMRTAILSNGSPTMLTAAVNHAGLHDRLDAVLSVDALKIYKPHPSTYRLACDRFGLVPAQIAFVSSNGWDVAGAASFGFRVIWLNRGGAQPECLPAGPAAEIRGLSELAAHL